MLNEIKTLLSQEIEPDAYGNKAYWLSWLYKAGFNVPFALFIPATVSIDGIKETYTKELDSKLLPFKIADNKYDVAVRSSATCEDSDEQSFAGHFLSVLGLMTLDEVISNIERVRQSFERYSAAINQQCSMGVIVQKRIPAKFSGVIFSSNPLSAAKGEVIVNISHGMGENLVGGKVAGENIVLTFDSQLQIPPYKIDLPVQFFHKLWEQAKVIEQKLERPVDIEWCVTQDSELYLLQCRPAITRLANDSVYQICLDNKDRIPPVVSNNKKIAHRLDAESIGIVMSKAFLIVKRWDQRNKSSPPLLQLIQPTKDCVGYSVVLIYPLTIKGKVIRSFASHDSLPDAISNISAQGFKDSWEIVIIVQEIFDPEYTGIAKKINENFLLEVAKGHFVPKGLVPASRYILNRDYQILSKSEVRQEHRFRIFGERILHETIPDQGLVSLSIKSLETILRTFKLFLESESAVVEFGLLTGDSSSISFVPFLIDSIDTKDTFGFTPNSIANGVVSSGRIEGSLAYIEINDSAEKSVDYHFHDQNEALNGSDEKVVFLCERPDISLLSLLNNHDPGTIGFIFKQASVLSHLPIVLRERNIPAVQMDDWKGLLTGWTVKLDAASVDIQGRERVKVARGYVSTYIYPDTDGVCSAIAYSYLRHKFDDTDFAPVVLGELGKETQYVLSFFEIQPPEIISEIPPSAPIILVDTHHKSQLPLNFPYSHVIEILDHHPAGDLELFVNADIQIEHVGSVATLITERLRKLSVRIQRPIAGMLASAIISNTLNFATQSTTQRDRESFRWLNDQCPISDDFIEKMFYERSNLSNVPTYEVLNKNYKAFSMGDIYFGISQIETVSLGDLLERSDLSMVIEQFQRDHNVDYYFANAVDILTHTTTFVALRQDVQRILGGVFNITFDQNRATLPYIVRRNDGLVTTLRYFFTKR